MSADPAGVPHVAVAGWSWTTIMVTLLNLLVGGGLVAWIKSRPKMRELNNTADERLRNDLLERVGKLESELKELRTHYETKVDRLQAEYEASARIARHELANAKMRFRALVMLLKRLPNPPDGLTAILSDIEAMEAEQMRAEAAEKGAQAGARIAAVNTAPGAPEA